MTKSNKTLLCCLLTCVMVLACALTILPIATPTTANAAETVVTFDFKAEGTNELSKYSDKLTDIKGKEYELILSSMKKVFPDVNGIKIGNSSTAGTFTFNIFENTSKVDIVAKQ